MQLDIEHKRNLLVVILVIAIPAFIRYAISFEILHFRYPYLDVLQYSWQVTVFWLIREFLPLLLYIFFVYVRRSSCSGRAKKILIAITILLFFPMLYINILTYGAPFKSRTTDPDNFGVYDKNAIIACGFPTEIPQNAESIIYRYEHSVYTEVECSWVLPESEFNEAYLQTMQQYEKIDGQYGYEEDIPFKQSLWITIDEAERRISYISFNAGW